MFGPTGSQTVSYAPDPTTGNPIPTVTQSLTPEQQRIFNTNQTGQQGLADLGLQGVNTAKGILGQPVSFDGAPAAPGNASATRDKVIDAMMGRVDTDLGRRREQTSADLIARGIPKDSEAYGREMEMIDRSRTDALQQAQIAAGGEASRDYGMDMGSRQQAITELLTQRSQPLNEISALRSGSQVSPIQGQNYGGANVGAAPIMGATQNQAGFDQNIFNQRVGTQNAQTNAAAQAASMYAMYAMMA